MARDGGPREHLVRIAQMTFDRKLTDAAGGNLSVRHGENALVTPRYAGGRYQWDLSPEQICEIDMQGNLIGSRSHRIQLQPSGPGVWSADYVVEHSGAYGLTVRVLPTHPLLANPFEVGLVAWA